MQKQTSSTLWQDTMKHAIATCGCNFSTRSRCAFLPKSCDFLKKKINAIGDQPNILASRASFLSYTALGRRDAATKSIISWPKSTLDKIWSTNTVISRDTGRISSCLISHWTRNLPENQKLRQEVCRQNNDGWNIEVLLHRNLTHLKSTNRGHQADKQTMRDLRVNVVKMTEAVVLPNLTRDRQKVLKKTITGFSEQLEEDQSQIRSKMSVLMNVLLHWHHPSAESRNQQSVICHKQ